MLRHVGELAVRRVDVAGETANAIADTGSSGATSEVPTIKIGGAVAVKAVRWNYLGSAAAMLMQVGYLAITSRLLAPAEIGAFAVAASFIQVIGYFASLGVMSTILRSHSEDAEMLRALVSICLVTGVVAFLFAEAMASYWSALMRSSESVQLLRLLAFGLPVLGLATIQQSKLRRRLLFRRAVVIEVSSQAAGFGIGLALLLIYRNVFALAVASPVSNLCLLVGGWIALREVDRPSLDIHAMLKSIGFGAGVAGQNLVHYILNLAPQWQVSREFGAADVGLFSRVSAIVNQPLVQITQTVSRTFYPLYPRYRHDLGAQRQVFADALTVTALVSAVVFGMIGGARKSVVWVIFGPAWSASTAIVPYLCVGAVASALYAQVAAYTECSGNLSRIWVWQGVGAVLVISALAVGASAHSVVVLVALLACALSAVHAIQLIQLLLDGSLVLSALARSYGGALGLGVFVYVFLDAIDVVLGGAWPALRCAIVGVIGVLLAVSYLKVKCMPGRAVVMRYFVSSRKGSL